MDKYSSELQRAIDALVSQHGLQRVVDAVSRNARNKKVVKMDYNVRLKQVKALMDEGLTNSDIALRLHLSTAYVFLVSGDVKRRVANKRAPFMDVQP